MGRTKQREVYVISTPKRPIPLEHSLYHDKKRYVVSKKGKFLNNGYVKVANLISGKDTSRPTRRKTRPPNLPTGRGGKGKGRQRVQEGGEAEWEKTRRCRQEPVDRSHTYAPSR